MVIHFECACQSQWGQNVYVIGSVKELGNWEVKNTVPLTCIEPGKWSGSIDFNKSSQTTINYKYIICDSEGIIIWEPGDDRQTVVNPKRFKNLYLSDVWQNTPNVQDSWNSSAFTKVLFKRETSDVKRFTHPAKANNVIEFRIKAPRIGKNYYLAIVGNNKELGEWDEQNAKAMNCSEFPIWKLSLELPPNTSSFEYKYLIFEKDTQRIATWEHGKNRSVSIPVMEDNSHLAINDGSFIFPDNNLKGAGVSVPVFSLKSANSFGVGDFSDLKSLMDWAALTGLKMVQILPVNDTISTHSFLDSYPYKAISVYALHPIFLDITKLGKFKNKEQQQEYNKLQEILNVKNKVDYLLVMKLKLEYAKQIFEQHKKVFLADRQFAEFFKANKDWLIPYAAFSHLRDTYKTSDFSQWDDYSVFNKRKIAQLSAKESKAYNEISFWYYVQFNLDKQLKEAAEYGRSKGVVLKGDIPIGISKYSVDAWYEPTLFHFDGQAGAPPDDFSVDGQNWGFPTYNWEEMGKDNFKWWQSRLTKMAEFFDAYRIDHILGFFRIWEIPYNAVQGILGYFRPAIPLSANELREKGVWLNYDRYCKPYIRGHFLSSIFGEYTDEVITKYLEEIEYSVFNLKPEFATQRIIYNHFTVESGPEDLSSKNTILMNGLMRLAAEVLLIPADGRSELYHPRISMHQTYSYMELDSRLKDALNAIYIDFFYYRHEEFWKKQALVKLPALVNATDMLICGEDLGMIPSTVPEVMNQFNILSLEIQRMPKNPKLEFAHPEDAPYMSVCTTSTHDMSTIRGYWEEDRENTQRLFNHQLGQHYAAPFFAEPWLCENMINQHLHSPAMWTVFPIQDLLAMDGEIRNEDTDGERINVPANPRHYWQYKMHLSIEELKKATSFNKLLLQMVNNSGRNMDY